DRERQRPTFVESRQQKKDEENAERENVDCAVSGELLLQRDLGPFGGEACRQNLLGETLDRGERVAGARARCRLPAEVGGGKHVVASNRVGAAYFLHGRQRTEWNNAARIISRFQQADVVGAQTKLRIGLSGDAIGASEKGKVVHIC